MSFVLFLLSFAFYLSGLCGTVPGYRDSGDLIASIHALGIAHPPGYALYVLFGKLFVTILPFGNIAYRVNVFSAFCAAAAVAVLYEALKKLSSPPVTALLISVLFATTPAVVALARVAEMYTLAAFIAAAILYFLVEGSPKSISRAAFLLGLGLSAHATLLFLLPLFVGRWSSGGVEKSRRDVTSPPLHFSTPLLYFLLGLSVFLYLPIRAAQHPLVNWGDPSSWRNFWRVVTRADYGGLKLHPAESTFSWTASSIATQLRYFAETIKGEWGWGALLAGAAGLTIGFKRPERKQFPVFLLASWVLAGPAFFLLSNLPIHENTTPAILQPYLLLSGLLLAPVIAMGISLAQSAGRFRPLAMTALAAFILATHPWSFPDQRNDFYAYDYARNLLRCLPPKAVLYDPDDPTHFSIQVLQDVEGRRRDVVLLNFFRTRWGYEEIKRRWPDLLPPVPIESGQELQRVLWTYSVQQRPFYAELPQKLTPVPYHAQGLAYAARVPSSAASRRDAETLLELMVRRGDFVTRHHPDFFTSHVISYYAAAENNLGIEYADAGDWRQAVLHYRKALDIEPDQAAAQNNLGIALQKMRKLI